jgi:molybdate transport system substrate-binding protein
MVFQLTGISSMATRQILADLVKRYEQLTGHEIEVKSMGGVHAARAVRAGEQSDFVILASNVTQQLETEGYILSGSRTDFARSGNRDGGSFGCAAAQHRR